MNLHPLVESDSPIKIAILIKDSAAKPSSVLSGYIQYISKDTLPLYGVAPLYYAPNNKVSTKDAKQYLDELLPFLSVKGITHLYVADSTYFKILTNEKKSDPWRGYILPCTVKGYEHLQVTLGYNYNVLFHNPTFEEYIKLTLNKLDTAILSTDPESVNTKFKYTEHSVINMTQKDADYWIDFLLNKKILLKKIVSIFFLYFIKIT